MCCVNTNISAPSARDTYVEYTRVYSTLKNKVFALKAHDDKKTPKNQARVEELGASI